MVVAEKQKIEELKPEIKKRRRRRKKRKRKKGKEEGE